MITGIAQVIFLKYFISVGRYQGSLLSFPMTLFSETATIKLMITTLILWQIYMKFEFRISKLLPHTATGALIAGWD